MWIRGNHKKRYTVPSSWHLFKERGTRKRFIRSYSVLGETVADYEDWPTVKSLDGYSWWESESESSETLPKKGKICGKCLGVYLDENRISEQSD